MKRHAQRHCDAIDKIRVDKRRSSRIVFPAPTTTAAAHICEKLSAGRVEIRACDDRERWWSGVFDNYRDLARSAKFAERSGFAVYLGLNPTDQETTNDIKPYRCGMRDDDVVAIRRILFDLDPIRETGSAADDMQLRFASDRACVLASFLTGYGWPRPTIAMSGNGYHLQYHTHLPNNSHIGDLMTDLYRGLGVRMTTAEVGFDTTVRNPSRICRMYGTTNRKSGRRSAITQLGDWQVVDYDQFRRTAESVKPPKPKAAPAQRKRTHGMHKGLDIVAMFQDLGLYKRQIGTQKHAVICPQSHLHSTPDHPHRTDTVIWEGEWPQFHCSHAHCEGVTIHDVLDRFA